MRRFPINISNSILGNIKYRNNVVTGEVAVDNGNNTYDVYIAGSDSAYPNIPTTLREPGFVVGEAVEILVEYGNKEMPIIIGRSKKIAQEFKEIEVSYSGGTPVTTLNAYSVMGVTAYLEGRISIEGMGNCTRQGFYYGTTTSYGLDVYSIGSFAAGSYNKQVTGLDMETTYHFQAYVLDANGDEQVGDDNTFSTLTFNLISCDIYEEKIYLYLGTTSTILDSFASPGTGPSGLTYAGTNLISVDTNTNTVYIHSGATSTVSDSFATPTTSPSGLAYDGTNLISIEYYDDKVYIHSGVTSSISSSFASPAGDPGGLTYTGTNLVSSDTYTNTIYIHSGITSTVSDSFATPEPSYGCSTNLTYDGTNLISVEEDASIIFIHSGVTSSITDSFASPSIMPYGLAYKD